MPYYNNFYIKIGAPVTKTATEIAQRDATLVTVNGGDAELIVLNANTEEIRRILFCSNDEYGMFSTTSYDEKAISKIRLSSIPLNNMINSKFCFRSDGKIRAVMSG